ncbi:hypothetical protein M271_18765 [Streptomyces rapamycinicus NRRL 5491]|nr:hypothetical protein M271_18765 [Streptomyces rapamycinicus NRRL 5491]
MSPASGEPGGRASVGVGQCQPVGADGQQGMGDGGARPARAEQHDLAGGRVGQTAAEGAGEAGPVGVVADRPAVLAEHHRVDRAEQRGVLRQPVEMPDHRLLAGMGDVEPVEAQPGGGPHQLADPVRAEPQRIDVDQAVEIPQPVAVGLALVEGGGKRGAHSGSDQPHQTGLPPLPVLV